VRTITATGPPRAPLVLVGAFFLGAIAAIPIAAGQRASVADLAAANPVGWVLGLCGLLAFMWFRAVDISIAGDPDYVIPRWRPHLVAATLGALSWLASVYHAYLIAEALARQ
jgi:hypothetical protein